MVCTFSHLSEEQIREIQKLENEVGNPLVAFSCFSIDPAELDSETLKRIRDLEERLGVALLAVRNTG